VHNCFSKGMGLITFRRSGEILQLEIAEGDNINTVTLAKEGYLYGDAGFDGEQHKTAAAWQYQQLPTGEYLIKICVHFVETPFTRILSLVLQDDKLTLTCDESPAVKDASLMLLDLAGVTRLDVFRSILPLLKKEKMQQRLRTFTTSILTGRLI